MTAPTWSRSRPGAGGPVGQGHLVRAEILEPRWAGLLRRHRRPARPARHDGGPALPIMCDNAYAVHDLYDDAPRLANVMDACRRHGTEDSLVLFGSTSKVTRAGAGISFIAGSTTTLDWFRTRMAVFTIGPDKVNQLRHVRFLQDLDGIRPTCGTRPQFWAQVRAGAAAPVNGARRHGNGVVDLAAGRVLPLVRRGTRSGHRDRPSGGRRRGEADAGRCHVPLSTGPERRQHPAGADVSRAHRARAGDGRFRGVCPARVYSKQSGSRVAR